MKMFGLHLSFRWVSCGLTTGHLAGKPGTRKRVRATRRETQSFGEGTSPGVSAGDSKATNELVLNIELTLSPTA